MKTNGRKIKFQLGPTLPIPSCFVALLSLPTPQSPFAIIVSLEYNQQRWLTKGLQFGQATKN